MEKKKKTVELRRVMLERVIGKAAYVFGCCRYKQDDRKTIERPRSRHYERERDVSHWTHTHTIREKDKGLRKQSLGNLAVRRLLLLLGSGAQQGMWPPYSYLMSLPHNHYPSTFSLFVPSEATSCCLHLMGTEFHWHARLYCSHLYFLAQSKRGSINGNALLKDCAGLHRCCC